MAFVHTHSQNVAHVDPWIETVNNVHEIEHEMTRLDNQCFQQTVMLSTANQQASSLDVYLTPVADEANSNEMMLTMIDNMQSTQTSEI